jgi:hypothetical protein
MVSEYTYTFIIIKYLIIINLSVNLPCIMLDGHLSKSNATVYLAIGIAHDLKNI